MLICLVQLPSSNEYEVSVFLGPNIYLAQHYILVLLSVL